MAQKEQFIKGKVNKVVEPIREAKYSREITSTASSYRIVPLKKTTVLSSKHAYTQHTSSSLQKQPESLPKLFQETLR